MKAIDLHKEFNKKYASVLSKGTIIKNAKRLQSMLSELNELRAKEGLEVLSLPILQKR